jgi:hypothetical protein
MEYSRVLPGTPAVPLGYWSARLSRRGRGPMRAVLSCAGAYVWGAAGSNECPAGFVWIETQTACRIAAAAVGKTFSLTESSPYFPRGCFYYDGNNWVYFNPHAVGAGRSTDQLLCAAATAGAPLKRRRRRTDARSACTGARACRHRACAARHARAVCVMHGQHIDTRTYINRYIYTYIYTYDANGARRRCRAAHGSPGGRRTGGRARGHARVLEGYSNMGTQKAVFKKGSSKKGSSKKGFSQRGTHKAVLKRVLKKGYSRIFNGAEKRLRVLAAVFAGYWRAVHGSPGHPTVGFVRHGTVEYSRGTHTVLTGYSRGQWIGRFGVHCRLFAGPRHAVQRMCAAPPRGLLGG